jgi:RNA-binding protein 25
MIVSRLPVSTSDESVLMLLKTCGNLKEWKRMVSANGDPKESGIAEYKDIESVFTCLKFIDGLEFTICDPQTLE